MKTEQQAYDKLLELMNKLNNEQDIFETNKINGQIELIMWLLEKD